MKPDTGEPINGAVVMVLGTELSGPGSVSGFMGGTPRSYTVSGVSPGSHYHVLAVPPQSQLKQLYLAEQDNVTVAPGQVTTVNLALSPVLNKAPQLTPQETPVVLVRGRGTDQSWVEGDSSTEWGYWAGM